MNMTGLITVELANSRYESHGSNRNVRNRFVQAALLFHMLDPVRGEPTVHDLDEERDESAERAPSGTEVP